jgi:hypothetical protein
MSIGFKPIRWEMMDEGGADFKEVKVIEATITPTPSNDLARITSAKSEELGKLIDELDGEKLPNTESMIKYLLNLAKTANDCEAPTDYKSMVADYRRALARARAEQTLLAMR